MVTWDVFGPLYFLTASRVLLITFEYEGMSSAINDHKRSRIKVSRSDVGAFSESLTIQEHPGAMAPTRDNTICGE